MNTSTFRARSDKTQILAKTLQRQSQEADMAYWIHENGETLGPMRAIDVFHPVREDMRAKDS